MSYVDFIVVPLKRGKEQEYKKICETFASFMKNHGLVAYCEAIADEVPHGKVTDFYRAVQATDDETVVAAFCTWPDKTSRDKAWEAFMKEPNIHSGQDGGVFDGKKMFYGGFKPLFQFGK